MKISKITQWSVTKFLASYILFWFVFLITAKLLFLLVYFNETLKLDFLSLLGIFKHGLKLDFSIIGYVLFFPVLVLLISSFFSGKHSFYILKIYNLLIFSVAPFLIVSDLVLYKYWGFRLDNTPLLYIKNPDMMIASVSIGLVLLGIISSAALSYIFIVLYNRCAGCYLNSNKKATLAEKFILIFLIPLLIIPVRGGFNTSPVNLSTAYFHSNNFANHAAINLFWNIGYSFTASETKGNPYNFMVNDSAQYYFTELMDYHITEERFLVRERPNVIMIILESITSRIIEPLGGKAGIMPNFNSLCQTGILFENFFASGDRSDKGIVALFSGFPALGNTSIMKFPNKAGKLPSFPRDLKNNGYHLSFYYGGDIEFFNLKSYLISCGFENILSDKHFGSAKSKSKWGAPDEYVFNKFYDDLIIANDTPFFKTIYTLSNHDPFDIPMEAKFKGSDSDNKFFSAAYYTDSCLNNFIQKFKVSDLWDNTLIIIVADHSSRLPGNIPAHASESFSIPMLWLGGAIAKDTIISKFGIQTDLPVTLLNQLNIKTADDYKFSRDVLSSESKGFAWYAHYGGFGFMTDSLQYIYNHNAKSYEIIKGEMNDRAISHGKSFLQITYDDFLAW